MLTAWFFYEKYFFPRNVKNKQNYTTFDVKFKKLKNEKSIIICSSFIRLRIS